MDEAALRNVSSTSSSITNVVICKLLIILYGFAILQFKDFLLIYNQMAELCFTRCVSNLGERSLTSQEVSQFLCATQYQF